MSLIDPVAAASLLPMSLAPIATAPTASTPAASFDQILAAGLRSVDARLQSADALVQRFALGDEIPIHQVTFALEQARLSVELAMQVRGRLLDGYRELMNMQL